MRLQDWRQIARRLASTARVEDVFPTVQLWHGTYAINVEGIRRQRIVPRAIDADAVVERAVQAVGNAYGFDTDQWKEFRSSAWMRNVRERIVESGFDKVYLSGEFDYAKSNAKASAEWMEYIITAASYVADEAYYELEHEWVARLSDAHKKIEDMDKRMRKMTEVGKAVVEMYDELRQYEDAYRQLEQDKKQALGDMKREVEARKKGASSAVWG